MGRNKKVVSGENNQGEELQPGENGTKEISEAIRATFEKHPHLLTVWANEDQSEWYFRPKPGFTPIERNEL